MSKNACEQTEFETDAVVIGAGPTGLFSVFKLGQGDIRCHVIDILDRAGGQCAELYPEKPLHDIPGFVSCPAQELVDRLVAQANQFEPTYHFGQMAEKLEKTDDGRWRVTTDFGTVITAKVVMVAAGGGSFVPKKPPIEGLDPFEGKSVFYAVRQKELFRDKNVVVAGGGDAALDWAIHLQPIAKKLTLIHRRDEFRAVQDSVNTMRSLVNAGKMDFKIATISAVKGDGNQLSAIELKEGTGTPYDYACDCLLAFYGLTMKLGPVATFGMTMEDGLIPVDPATFETNLSGVFAIGDICSYPGKMKFILGGLYEACGAAKKALSYVHPDRRFKLR